MSETNISPYVAASAASERTEDSVRAARDARLKEEDAVIWAACRLIDSDISVYPNMSRADAVNEAYWLLDSAVHRLWSLQPPSQAEGQANEVSGSSQSLSPSHQESDLERAGKGGLR